MDLVKVVVAVPVQAIAQIMEEAHVQTVVHLALVVVAMAVVVDALVVVVVDVQTLVIFIVQMTVL